jgi:class 3 adenylate cyclase
VSFAGPAWSELFDRVLSRASQVIIASPKRSENDGLTYDYANLMLHGLATVRAAELELTERQPVGLAVWNGCPGDGNGGTESIVRRWQGLGMQVDQVDISAVPIDPAATFPVVKNPILSRGPSHSPEAPGDDTRIMAMLFGDAVNFSKLDEEQVRRFIQYFMSPIAEIVRSFHVANVVRNTWGDSLYLVFDHVREAGLCALKISKLVRGQIATGSWKKLHLPGDLNVRLALHAGPLFKCTDPITGHMNYTGTHVSRAARLEPKTPPGEVYASEAFAAICATYGVADFSLEYVRQLAWAKHYGTFPTFVLRQRTK